MRNVGLNVAFLGTLLLLALGGGMYYVYVTHQAAYITGRNFRQLSAWSQGISKSLEVHKKVLENLASAEASGKQEICQKKEEQCVKLDDEEFLKSFLPLKDIKINRDCEADKEAYSIKHSFTGLISELLLVYTSLPEKASQTSKACSSAKIQVKQLVNLGGASEGVFDEIVLANHEGVVFFQWKPFSFRIPSLKSLLHTSSSPAAQSEEKPTNQGNTLIERLLMLKEVEIGGTKYELFAQPVRLPSTASGSGEESDQWIIAGFVESTKFWRDARAFSHSVLLLILFVVLGLAFSLPFFKLWTMGPRDRLRPADVFTLMAVSLMGTALLTFFFLDIYAYWRLAEQSDDDNELQQFAERLVENFTQEIGQAVGELDRLNNSHVLQGDLKEIEGEESKVKIRAQAYKLLREKGSGFPDPIMVIWIDKKGEQRIKWTVKNLSTPPIYVGDRLYVEKVLQGERELWQLNGTIHRFWIQPILSWTTGQFSTMVSMPGPDGGSDKGQVAAMEIRLGSLQQPVLPPGFGFAIVEKNGDVKFHVKEKRSLRENFFEETDYNRKLQGLVFGRASGHVNGKYWGRDYQFYVKPVDLLPWSLIAYRSKEPLRTFNFEVLVLSVSLFLGYYALVLLGFLALGFLLFLLRLLGFRTDDSRPGQWMWPRPDYQDRYHFIICANIVLMLAFGASVALTYEYPVRMLWVVLSIPVVAAVLMYRGLTKKQTRVTKYSPCLFADHRRSYMVMAMTVMGILAMLPAFAFFTVAHDAEMRLLVKHEQLGLAKGLEKREQEVRDLYREVKVGEQDMEEFLRHRLDPPDCQSDKQKGLDVFGCFLFDTYFSSCKIASIGPRSESEQGEFLGHLSQLFRQLWLKTRVVYNQESQETHGLILEPAEPSLDKWEQKPNSRLELCHKNIYSYHTDIPSEYQIASTVPIFWGQLSLSTAAWIGLIVLLLSWLLYRLLRFIAEKVFHLNLEHPLHWNNLSRFWPVPIANHANLLFLGPPGCGKSQFASEQGWHRIDLREIGELEDWFSTTTVQEAIRTKDRTVIAIDHFTAVRAI
jgi:hypothetical protein